MNEPHRDNPLDSEAYYPMDVFYNRVIDNHLRGAS
jgi:hypothetical protein